MTVKTAKKVACAYELTCPHCAETLPSPGGSLFWTTEEIELGALVACPACQQLVRLPQNPRRRNGR